MSKDKEKAIFPEPIEVPIGHGDKQRVYKVFPLVREKYQGMFKMIGDIIKDFAEGEISGKTKGLDLSNIKNIMNSIPYIISTFGSKLGEIYAYVLDHKNPEEMLEFIQKNMTMDQEARLLYAIIKQNDGQKIVKNLKMVAAEIKMK